jgi:hypothetical protein
LYLAVKIFLLQLILNRFPGGVWNSVFSGSVDIMAFQGQLAGAFPDGSG